MVEREHYHAMIVCDFKVGLYQKDCLQYLQLAYENDDLSYSIVFR